MAESDFVDEGGVDTPSEELDRFRSIRWLINHWARPQGPRAYYWYLTFENAPDLRSLAEKCQRAISFPYYDATPPFDLHLTLDRVAFEGDITREGLAAIRAAAMCACRDITPFDVTVGSLGGTPGAIGFTAYPEQPLRSLRDHLRRATLSIHPSAPIKHSEFHPHVAIAYCNSDNVPAAEAIAAVEGLNATASIRVTVTEASLVLLERHPRAYAWSTFFRIPFSGP